MDDSRLALLRELEQAEEATAAELAEIDELYGACEAVRTRALELEAFSATLPEERAAAQREIEESERALAEARATAERADEELRAAEAQNDPERSASARRFHVRAHDALTMAERRVREAQVHSAALEAQAKAAAEETERLAARARELAAALRERPRVAGETLRDPGPNLAAVAEWGTQVRAALLVTRNQLAAERDALVRQANELAAGVLGEPVAPMSAAGVARLVRRTLEPS
jgi:chromosome segregation ATPase